MYYTFSDHAGRRTSDHGGDRYWELLGQVLHVCITAWVVLDLGNRTHPETLGFVSLAGKKDEVLDMVLNIVACHLFSCMLAHAAATNPRYYYTDLLLPIYTIGMRA